MSDPAIAARSTSARASLSLVRAYQKVVSPLLGGNCRYYPTCSHYTYEAIEIHGAAKGSWLGIKRIGRCHPFHEGGIDPVPGSTDGMPHLGEGSSS
jgi:putative membrane protein insertion efficiency factor